MATNNRPILCVILIGTVPGSGVSRDKVSDDASIKLSVHAKAQWNFTKPSFTKELQPPLQPNNLILLPSCYLVPGDLHLNCNNTDTKNATFVDGEDNMDERWLSQVEICTHSGPHRRLWMGPQFTFKIFNSNSYVKKITLPYHITILPIMHTLPVC